MIFPLITDLVYLFILAVQCDLRDHRHWSKHLIVQADGNHIGHRINYTCPKGFLLNGTNFSECLANGKCYPIKI